MRARVVCDREVDLLQGHEPYERGAQMVTGTRVMKASVLAFLVHLAFAAPGIAAPGDLLSTVTLPGGGSCSVSGTLAATSFGTHYLTIQTNACSGTTIGVYAPCVGLACAATLVATKTVGSTLSGLAWDPSRTTAGNVVVWGVHANAVYKLDLGDPTVSGPAVQTFLCNTGVGGIGLTDGLAYDASDDTLSESPDVNLSVFQFSLGTMGNGPACTLLNTISPEDINGKQDGKVRGVAIGAPGTLYIGRNGDAEIRQVFNPSGVFISQFTTTAGRVEALTCDPITYAPLEAILAKDAFSGLYEAFEVAPETCPLPSSCVDPDPRTQGFWRRVCKKDHPAQPDRSILTAELCEDLNPDPHSDPCERARSQLAAVLYNIASDRLDEGCVDDNTGNDVGATVDAIESLIAEGTNNSCKTASSLAASINEGNVSEP